MLAEALAAATSKLGLSQDLRLIPPEMTFRQWCEKLAAEGLKIDGKPFRRDNRPALAWVYDQIPTTIEDCFNHTLVLMKCSQVGFTVLEMLAAIYMGLKFSPATIGTFLPDQALAQLTSSERFMPILRTVPEAYNLMTEEDPRAGGRKPGEGNVRTRRIGESLYLFAWTSGRVTTESVPMDVLVFDEVQEMALADMEKTRERLSASSIRYNLMGSTANWPDADIHHWFKQGTQHEFLTRCPTCGAEKSLDEYFPNCIRFDEEAIDSLTGVPGTYRYVCENGHWIDEPQLGRWEAKNPIARIKSLHFPQMLSPTITASEIMEKYLASTDKKNFYNRVLGRPFLDPSMIPVTLEHMRACVNAGKALGLRWKTYARGCFMGIDQMGNFNVVMIKERLEDGRQAVVHLEEIYGSDPFARCDELMEAYGVAVACVEINPNYNDAKKFATRWSGRVFICNSFGSLPDEMLRWGDAPKLDVSERRTDEEARDRYTVRVDQYKCMQTSFARFTTPIPTCLWPDDQELFQDVIEKGLTQRVAVAPRAFYHFTKTALVAEKDEETNQFKRSVRKVGIDPHWSYANQLCDVAWARAHGTASFFIPGSTPVGRSIPDRRGPSVLEAAPTREIFALVETCNEQSTSPNRCGTCANFEEGGAGRPKGCGFCVERNLVVTARDPECELFLSLED